MQMVAMAKLAMLLIFSLVEIPRADFIVSLPANSQLAANSEMKNVYLSIVMVGRHDDNRGDYTGRIQNSLDFFLSQGTDLRVSMEIVIVEWNPISGSARFPALLRSPPGCKIPVRVIAVEAAFHQTVAGSTSQSFFEFMAKNVGARRSHGKFVLFTNGDVVLSPSVMKIFAAQTLDEASFYRIGRTELPGLLDPLAPLESRVEVMHELLSMLSPEQTCDIGQQECPGNYNRGVCERMSEPPNRKDHQSYPLGPAHRGLEDEPFLPAAGDFFLMSRRALHAIGGYHQVASTTHLDSLLVCKAKGAGYRQVVLLRPCYMVHQRHPAPQQPLRYILPGWELSDTQCAHRADEARAFMQKQRGQPESDQCTSQMWDDVVAQGCGTSMDPDWGFPAQKLEETMVASATLSKDWQALTLLPIHEQHPHPSRHIQPYSNDGDDECKQQCESSKYVWERSVALWILAGVRFHQWRAVTSFWCAFEAYSRWSSERQHIPMHVWQDRMLLKTCRTGDHEQLLAPLEHVQPQGVRKEDKAVYVSAVMAARVDDRRGDSVLKLQNAIDAILHGFEKYSVRGEIIIVEWMPVTWRVQGAHGDHAVSLERVLRVRNVSKVHVRIITVHEAQMRREWNVGYDVTFLEYHAKNIGARRAQGRFLLLTNSDAIPSDSIFKILGAESLHPGSVYRTSSTDLPAILDVQAPLHQRMCALKRLEALLGSKKTSAATSEGSKKTSAATSEEQHTEGMMCMQQRMSSVFEDDAMTHHAGDLTLISRTAFNALGGYHQVPTTMHLDSLLLCAAQGLRLKLVLLGTPCTSFHQSHPAPVREMRYVHPGWEWSHALCQACEDAAQQALQRAGGSLDLVNMTPSWGYPDQDFAETSVKEAGVEDWQWRSLEMDEWDAALHPHQDSLCYPNTQSHVTGEIDKDTGQNDVHVDKDMNHDSKEWAQHKQGRAAGVERVVFCVASTSQRVWRMEEALTSLRQQSFTPDAIYVSLPQDAAVPPFLAGTRIVTHDIDMGPVHKLLDCAREEDAADTILITFDDDMQLDAGLAERLVVAARDMPDSAVGFAGWNARALIGRHPPHFDANDFISQHLTHSRLPCHVDVLEGYAGVAYRRSFLDLSALAAFHDTLPEARFADDVWISANLARRGIKRVVVALREGLPKEATGIPIDAMFRDVWVQTMPQTEDTSLKRHPDRARRNQIVATAYADMWSNVTS